MLIRVLKVGLSVILMAGAILLALGEYEVLRHLAHGDETAPAPVSWAPHATAFLLISFCLCAAWLLLRKKSDPTAGIYCPHCRAAKDFTVESSHDDRTISPGAWHFGGVFFAALYHGSKAQRFRCETCQQTFRGHTSATRGYFILVLILFGLVAVRIGADILEIYQTN